MTTTTFTKPSHTCSRPLACPGSPFLRVSLCIASPHPSHTNSLRLQDRFHRVIRITTLHVLHSPREICGRCLRLSVRRTRSGISSQCTAAPTRTSHLPLVNQLRQLDLPTEDLASYGHRPPPSPVASSVYTFGGDATTAGPTQRTRAWAEETRQASSQYVPPTAYEVHAEALGSGPVCAYEPESSQSHCVYAGTTARSSVRRWYAAANDPWSERYPTHATHQHGRFICGHFVQARFFDRREEEKVGLVERFSGATTRTLCRQLTSMAMRVQPLRHHSNVLNRAVIRPNEVYSRFKQSRHLCHRQVTIRKRPKRKPRWRDVRLRRRNVKPPRECKRSERGRSC